MAEGITVEDSSETCSVLGKRQHDQLNTGTEENNVAKKLKAENTQVKATLIN